MAYDFFPYRIILDEAVLFLSDKVNAVSVNLARGEELYTFVLFQNMSTKRSGFIFLFVCFQTMCRWLIWGPWN